MREVKGDFWTYPADWWCIPTNGTVGAFGKAVMDTGVALEAKEKCPRIDIVLGRSITRRGNRVYGLMNCGSAVLFSFPTQRHYREEAHLGLIRRSCIQLHEIWLNHGGTATVVLPRSGWGVGGLEWAEVEPILGELLPEDNFVVIA